MSVLVFEALVTGRTATNVVATKLNQLSIYSLGIKGFENVVDHSKRISIFPGTTIKRYYFHLVSSFEELRSDRENYVTIPACCHHALINVWLVHEAGFADNGESISETSPEAPVANLDPETWSSVSCGCPVRSGLERPGHRESSKKRGNTMIMKAYAVGIAVLTASSLLAVELDEDGCRLLSKLPPPGIHPRIFFTADEYPLMRERLEAPHFKAKFAAMRQQSINSCVKGKWRELAAADFVRKGITDQDLLTWFKGGEGRNVTWGLASVHAVIEGEEDLQAVMRRIVVNYARVILASKKRANGIDFNTLPKELQQRLKIWKSDRWDVGVGWTFGASGYATAYDVLYNTMSKEERSIVRQAIAAATKGRKSYGNGLSPGFASSNHYGYHGDLAVMLSAIEGEPGFDRKAWDGIVRVLRDYWEKAYTPFGYSREDGYGPNLGLRGGGRGYMVLARRGYNIFATDKYRRVVEYVAMDYDPYPGGHLNGGASGGPYGELYPTSTLLARYMYPRNPTANLIYRHMVGEGYRRRLRWQGLLDYLVYGSDWQGPESREEMLKTTNLPLSMFYPVRGKFIARSDWSGDATYLTFDARPDAHLIGHDKVDRGNFSMSALGRVWAFSGDFHQWDLSRENSLVHIDGKAQPWKAPSVRFLWHADDGTVAGGAADLKYAYDWEWSPPWPKWGQKYPAPWEPETNSPIDLGWPEEYGDPDLCPASIHGSHTGYGGGRNNLHRRPYNKVAKALRSAFLIRGENPYALICDDIRKDASEHLYEWVMQLPTDLDPVSNTGNEVILKEAEGNRCLLVRFLQQATCRTRVESYQVAEDKRRGTVTLGKRFIASLNAVDPGYRVMLYPFRKGKLLPETKWDANGTELTVSFAGQTDTLSFKTTEKLGTRVVLSNKEAGDR